MAALGASHMWAAGAAANNSSCAVLCGNHLGHPGFVHGGQAGHVLCMLVLCKRGV